MQQQGFMKIVMLGEGRVGKTSLTLRFCKNIFDDKQQSTVNASYLENTITLDGGTQAKLAIWDTAGQEKFHALAPMYYKDADGAVLVYDITSKESLAKVDKWLKELKQFAKEDIVLAIAGNKCDMESQREVKKDVGEEIGKNEGAQHFSTSAKSGAGIKEMFTYLGSKINDQNSKKSSKKKNNLILSTEDEAANKKKKEKCCSN